MVASLVVCEKISNRARQIQPAKKVIRTFETGKVLLIPNAKSQGTKKVFSTKNNKKKF